MPISTYIISSVPFMRSSLADSISVVANGLGHHTCNVPEEQVDRFIRVRPSLVSRYTTMSRLLCNSREFSQIAFALQRANQPVLCCVKVSILLFYHRGKYSQFHLLISTSAHICHKKTSPSLVANHSLTFQKPQSSPTRAMAPPLANSASPW